MRFLADMGISPRTVTFLKSRGYGAVHLHARGLQQMEDSAILEMAKKEGRVVLAHDLDFGELMAASGGMLPSVVVFQWDRRIDSSARSSKRN